MDTSTRMTYKEYDFLNSSILSENYLKLIHDQKTKVWEIYLSSLLVAVEVNNKNKIMSLCDSYMRLNKYTNIPIEHIHSIIIAIDKAIFNSNMNDLDFLNKTQRFLGKIFQAYKSWIKIKISYVNYFRIYEMWITLSSKTCINLISEKNNSYQNINKSFIHKAHKFFHFTLEDYPVVKGIIYRFTLSNNSTEIVIGLTITKMFLPAKMISEDWEFQEHLFLLLNTHRNYASSLWNIFKRVLKYKLLINKEAFIKIFFEILMNYFSSTMKKIEKVKNINSYTEKKKNSPSNAYKKTQKYTISYSMCWIFVKLYIDKEYKLLLNNQVNVWINFMNINLGESSESEWSQVIWITLNSIWISLKKQWYTEEKIQLTKVKYESNYTPTKAAEEQVNDWINKFIPWIVKCLFYYEEDGLEILTSLMDWTYPFAIHEQIWLTFIDLYTNGENDISTFLRKWSNYWNVFMNDINVNNDKCFHFIMQIITTLPGWITSANQTQNISVLVCIVNWLQITKDANKSTVNWMKIKEKVNDICWEVMRNVWKIFDFVLSSSIRCLFMNFCYMCTKYVDEKKLETIINLLLTYPKDNYISPGDVSSYLLCICTLPYKSGDVITRFYNDLIDSFTIPCGEKERKMRDGNKNPLCLVRYDISSICFDIEEVFWPKKRIKSWIAFFDYFDFSLYYYHNVEKEKQMWYNEKGENCEENGDKEWTTDKHPVIKKAFTKLVEISVLSLNSKSKQINKLGISIIRKIINDLLTRKKANYEIYDLPGEEELYLVLYWFDIFILPYLLKIKEIVSSYNILLQSKQEKIDENTFLEWMIDNYEYDDDDIKVIFYNGISLFSTLLTRFENPFLSWILITRENEMKKYSELNRRIALLKEELLICLPFIKKLNNDKILKKIAKIYTKQNNDSVSSYTIFIKLIKLYYPRYSIVEFDLYSLFYHQYFYFISLRYFNLTQVTIDSNNQLIPKSITNSLMWKEKEESQCWDSLKHILKWFTSSFLTLSISQVDMFLYWQINKFLTNEQVFKIYTSLYEDIILMKIKKVLAKSTSQTRSEKIYNIIMVYVSVISFALLSSTLFYDKILSDFIKTISLFKDKNDLFKPFILIEHIIKVKKKHLNYTTNTLLQNRLKSLLSYNKLTYICIKDHIYTAEINRFDLKETIKENREIIENENKKIHSGIISFFSDYTSEIEKDKNYFSDTNCKHISIFLFNLMIYLFDYNLESDYSIWMKLQKIYFSNFISKDIVPLVEKKMMWLSFTLCLIIQFELQNEYFLCPVSEGIPLNECIITHKRNQIIMVDDKAMYSITPNKLRNISISFITSFEDLSDFFVSLIKVKDLISDQKIIQSNSKNSADGNNISFNDINKNTDYKMISRFIYLESNETEVINYKNVDWVHSQVLQENKYDNNIINIIYIQFIGGWIMKDIKQNNLWHTDKAVIQEYLRRIMNWYTNNKNKFIDNAVWKFFSWIINGWPIKEIKKYFIDEATGTFFYFEHDIEFVLEINYLMSTSFHWFFTFYLFNNVDTWYQEHTSSKTLTAYYSFLEKSMMNKLILSQYMNKLIVLMHDYLVATKQVYYSPKLSKFINCEGIKDYVMNIMNKNEITSLTQINPGYGSMPKTSEKKTQGIKLKKYESSSFFSMRNTSSMTLLFE